MQEVDDFFDEEKKFLVKPELEGEEFDSFDASVEDIDFSEFSGKNFKHSLKKVHKAVSKRAAKKKKRVTNIPVNKFAKLRPKFKNGVEQKTTRKVIVPSNQKVIIQGVNDFILSQSSAADSVKNIGYYKGRKLKELILTLDNSNSLVDFNLELFNPSEPLDYLYSTSGNLNNKITTSGADLSYSDVLYNILGNPAHIVNAKFTFSGANPTGQINQSLIVKDKSIDGKQKVDPINIGLQIDNMQVANDLVFFCIMDVLNRPFIPNGVDVIQYKVLAGNICTFCFYYDQKDLRKVFFEEAKNSKKLL